MTNKICTPFLVFGTLLACSTAPSHVLAETHVYKQPGSYSFTAPLGLTPKVTIIGGGGGGGGGGGALDRVVKGRGGGGGSLVCSVSTTSNLFV